MIESIQYGAGRIDLRVPDGTTVYHTSYPAAADAAALVLNAVRAPLGSLPLLEQLRQSGARSVVVVVSDITRPIPYAAFLQALLEEIEAAGIQRPCITILIATGMHRPSTPSERDHMFGAPVCRDYCIRDHLAENPEELVRLSGNSHAGRPIELNRHLLAADFRIVTGLVEPHFMAGFSGGRKAICPGLCSLETVKAFHSFAFLDNPYARNGNLPGNPLHDESRSIACRAGIGFCINVVVNRDHRLVAATAGDLEKSHQAACALVGKLACPPVARTRDVVITSCGGYPLDATFYQCVKGMCAALPAVRPGGGIVAIGECSEGIGGAAYQDLLRRYEGRWQDFIADAQSNPDTAKDQWEFQMQTKVLAHVGETNLFFITGGIDPIDLARISVNGMHVTPDLIQSRVQELVDRFVSEGRSLAIIPEGPYCTPLA